MKGKTYMKQETIKVELLEDNKKDILRFHVDNDYDINLDSSKSQEQLKRVFSILLEKLVQIDIELELCVNDRYSKALYKEVCSEYIKDLNKEIKKVRSELIVDYKDDLDLLIKH